MLDLLKPEVNLIWKVSRHCVNIFVTVLSSKHRHARIQSHTCTHTYTHTFTNTDTHIGRNTQTLTHTHTNTGTHT